VHPAHAAPAGTTILYAWIADGNLWVRTSTLAGVLGGETKVLDATATHAVEHVRLVTYGSAFAAIVRWRPLTDSLKPKLELYPFNASGAVAGAALLIDEPTALTPYGQSRGFGAAVRSSHGAGLVTWAGCDGTQLCAGDVYARLVGANGTLGQTFNVPTTVTDRPQFYPSVAALPDAFVVAWTDASWTPPDASGSAVRARIVTP